MSRIGRLPVVLPQGVEVTVSPENLVTVKGPKGTLQRQIDKAITVKVENGHVVCTRESDEKEIKSKHGLYRKLIANMVEGVTKGFSKSLEVVGVGYRVAVKGNMVELSVGYSHPVIVELPEGIKASAEGQVLTLTGINKELVGEMAAKIRRIRKPEPYKGKGIKYTTEIIRRKVGKSGGKK